MQQISLTDILESSVNTSITNESASNSLLNKANKSSSVVNNNNDSNFIPINNLPSGVAGGIKKPRGRPPASTNTNIKGTSDTPNPHTLQQASSYLDAFISNAPPHEPIPQTSNTIKKYALDTLEIDKLTEDEIKKMDYANRINAYQDKFPHIFRDRLMKSKDFRKTKLDELAAELTACQRKISEPFGEQMLRSLLFGGLKVLETTYQQFLYKKVDYCTFDMHGCVTRLESTGKLDTEIKELCIRWMETLNLSPYSRLIINILTGIKEQADINASNFMKNINMSSFDKPNTQ